MERIAKALKVSVADLIVWRRSSAGGSRYSGLNWSCRAIESKIASEKNLIDQIETIAASMPQFAGQSLEMEVRPHICYKPLTIGPLAVTLLAEQHVKARDKLEGRGVRYAVATILGF
jgi:hypothetical protein